MNRRWTILLLAAAGAAGARAQAPATNVYTLEDCLRVGLTRSAAASNAVLDYAIAGARMVQARAEAIPQLSLSSSYTRLDELQAIEFGGQSVTAGTLDNYAASAEVSQLLYGGGRVGAALRAARLARSLADHTRTEVTSALARDIRIGFCDVLLAEAALDVRRESLAQLEALLAQVAERERGGTASEFEVLGARVRVANERPALIAARNGYELALENLRRTVNPGEGPFLVRGELNAPPPSVPPLDELLGSAMERRAVLQQLEAVLRLRETDMDAAKSATRPSVTASFSYNGANSYGFVSYGDEWQWHWNAGLVLRWDVWDGGLTRGVVSEKRLEAFKARVSLAEMRRLVAIEVRQSYLDRQAAEEAVAASEGTVELARKARDIASARYRSGLATQLEFTDANLAVSTAGLRLAQARRDRLAALARLRHACGLGEEGFARWQPGAGAAAGGEQP